MPTTRMIDPQIWISGSMAKLTFRQRLLFIGLFSNADDQGRTYAHPQLVRSKIFPYDEIQPDEILTDLAAIEREECIKIYDDNGKPVLQILNWWKFQHPQWAYPSNISPLPEWHDRLRYRRGNEVITDNWNVVLPIALGKALPKGQGGAIELELALESEIVKPLGAPAPTTTSPRDQLRFDMTPQGALMAQKLRVVYESKGRKPPEFYGNALQRDAYLIAFSALGDNLGRLLDRAMQKEIIERGKLLDWLNGCVRNGNGKERGTFDPTDKLAQATALTRERLKNGKH